MLTSTALVLRRSSLAFGHPVDAHEISPFVKMLLEAAVEGVLGGFADPARQMNVCRLDDDALRILVDADDSVQRMLALFGFHGKSCVRKSEDRLCGGPIPCGPGLRPAGRRESWRFAPSVSHQPPLACRRPGRGGRSWPSRAHDVFARVPVLSPFQSSRNV